MLTVGQELHTYTWIDNWVKVPEVSSARKNGRTLGIVCTDDQKIVVFHQSDPGILIYSQSGKLAKSWGGRFLGAHSASYVKEGDREYLWLCDENSCEVVKTTMDGEMVMQLERPDHAMYSEGTAFIPTSIAVFEERYGGNGDIWVSDGYGASLVHQYDKFGNWLNTISGDEGKSGRFSCPHGLAFRYDRAEPELYIADRGHERIQVYNPEGQHMRTIEGMLHSPCSFTFFDGCTYIPELFTGIKILDPDDQLIASIGDHDGITTAPGWPNMGGTDWVKPGLFNSPHDLTVDAAGNVYVAEWIIGGRVTKLEKVIS
ncbi:NHL repeat protein [Poriferisphaera corsica]|uniref:NHL repeat protein n=1 Tax=Poriferisphaera corsica TaxID=2528020 RepID=A0A517YUZ9_9BACT|nr:hypothetical protein [Poriferisphaera corsica]QDU34083.1 NHL repeat protein [Poriferisphaera corsica]